MIDFVLEFVNAHVALVAVASGSLILLTFAAIFSALVWSVRVLLWTFAQANGRQILILLGICAVWGGFAYFAGYVISATTRLTARKKTEKREHYRALQFALPDRENSYVRGRIENALQVEEKGGDGIWKTEFAYARSLLAKLKGAEVSAVDKLQIDELAKLLAVYGKRERLSTADLPLINEAFAMILKLSAKYGVNP